MNTIAVASGKGGVGKTTLTANLGVALASSGRRVVLFDADLGLANLDVVLGLKSDINVQPVIDGFARIPEAAVQGPAGIRVVTGGSGISAMLRLSRKRLDELLSQVAELADSADIVIFDAASGADARVMSFLKFADEAILVTTPDPASIVDCYSTAKVLFRYRKDADIRIIVNRVEDENQALKVFETVQSAVQTFLHKPISYLGFVREDRGAAEITRTRRPFVTTVPDLPASRDIVMIAATLMRNQQASENKVGDAPSIHKKSKKAA